MSTKKLAKTLPDLEQRQSYLQSLAAEGARQIFGLGIQHSSAQINLKASNKFRLSWAVVRLLKLDAHPRLIKTRSWGSFIVK